jgi:hypothetical protein
MSQAFDWLIPNDFILFYCDSERLQPSLYNFQSENEMQKT